MTIELTLLGKPGCHLCDEAREVIAQVMQQFSLAKPDIAVELKEIDILQDQVLFERYKEEIPVLLINDKVHNYWRIDDERLMRALHSLSS